MPEILQTTCPNFQRIHAHLLRRNCFTTARGHAVDGMRVANCRTMDHTLSRLLTASALVVSASVFCAVACTHTTDRVVEPPGGADASPSSPEAADAGVSPIGPIAHPVELEPLEPKEDFRLVRAPEFGLARDVHL